MILEPIKPRVLGLRAIPNVDPQLARDLKLAPHHRALGLITCTSDDALYTALDAGTKAAEVDVVYARSFYAGSAHASGPLSGEVIGIFAAADEEIVASGISAALRYLETSAWFYAADDAGKLAFFPHVIPSVGRYLAGLANVAPGTPMAYLIAPPIEATLGLDAALKAADVELKVFYAPPSETNYAGGLLTGSVESVEAAARAFQETVMDLAARPRVMTPAPDLEVLTAGHARARGEKGAGAALPYRVLESGLELADKPDGLTHLFDNRSLVPKGHPAIRFRGRLDLLQAQVLDAQFAAQSEGLADVVADLEDVLRFLRQMLGAEVSGRPMPELSVGGFSGEELHRLSHNTMKFFGVGWVVPDVTMGPTAIKLNLLRATCREVEIAAEDAYGDESHLSPGNRDAMLHGLNRLSNAVYVLVCKVVARKKGQAPGNS
jgi:ethanolamine utilization protein EutL